MATLYIRHEISESERRTPLIPSDAQKLVQKGHKILVESCSKRICSDSEYIMNDCKIVEKGTWRHTPANTIILGLKNLPENDFDLNHRHIFFAHAYNHQRIFDEKHDSLKMLKRFKNGAGTHYDIEFLMDESKKRVCAFGEMAGVAGACIALLVFMYKIQQPENELCLPFNYSTTKHVYSMIEETMNMLPIAKPSILVIGSNGRCGRGVQRVLNKFGMHWDGWGRHDTANPKTLHKIVDYNLVFNCAYIQDKISPFLTVSQLAASKNLSVVADISCETSSNNPLRLYERLSTFEKPAIRIKPYDKTIDIIAINNLPAFFPLESSQRFSQQILPHLADLLNDKPSKVWCNAKNIFNLHMKGI